MPKYQFQASHSVEGLQGLLKDGGTRRREAIERLMNGMVGSLEAFYSAFGDSAYMSSRTFPTRCLPPQSLSIRSIRRRERQDHRAPDPGAVGEAVGRTVDWQPPGTQQQTN